MNSRIGSRTMTRGFLATVLCVLAGATGWAEQVKLDVAMANPVLLANQKQTSYLRVAMAGLNLPDSGRRTPINVAIVLDRSGSMRGEKIEKAKEAAVMAVGRLRADDIFSLVVYDTTVDVVVPATKVQDRELVCDAIRRIQPGNTTALFAGVSKGAMELRKFLDRRYANRIILLSDGLANEGPSTPGDLAELGTSLGREGITVSTIGLGLDYNEDLMTALAQKSDGNHIFAENAQDLDKAFTNEFGDVLSVVAQGVKAVVRCAEGIRPVRVLGREADIVGQTVTLNLNQVYGGQMKYLVLEVEVPPRNELLTVANVDLTYTNMATLASETMHGVASVSFSESPSVVEASVNKDVMASVVQQTGLERNRLALRLSDEGRTAEAQELLRSNAAYLYDNSIRLDSEALADDAMRNTSQMGYVRDDPAKARKDMRYWQHGVANQQRGRR